MNILIKYILIKKACNFYLSPELARGELNSHLIIGFDIIFDIEISLKVLHAYFKSVRHIAVPIDQEEAKKPFYSVD